MLSYWDRDQVCLFANEAHNDWFGKSGQEVMGLTMLELLGPSYEKNLPYILAALKGEKQVFEREIPTPNGEVRHSIAIYTPDIVDDKVQGFIVLDADVSPMKALEQELIRARTKAEHLAVHDFLTGLPNRVLMVDRIKQAILLANRKKTLIAVMMIDMDNFKEVNDTYGHSHGDRLLVEISSRMKESIREYDTISRYGGDEFLLVSIPEINDRKDVYIVITRLLGKVNQPFEINSDIVISPAISIGIALYPQNGKTAEELMVKADEALYAAKRLGKNRYMFAE
jgi:diguanylate cyclase (GGDEF)-like protein/PAS domain S-box-containing protein